MFQTFAILISLTFVVDFFYIIPIASIKSNLFADIYGRLDTYRGVARDKSMYRQPYFREVRGHAPWQNFDILYRRSCILDHFKAYFEGFVLYFAAFAKTKNIFFFKCKLSTHKIKSRIIENLPFCIHDTFITWA